MTVSDSRLRDLVERFEMIEARLAISSDSEEITKLSKECSQLSSIAAKARAVLKSRADLTEAMALLSSDEPELVELAREEKIALSSELTEMEHDMQLLLLPKDRDDEANVVLEIRAGTGGDEAALFAGDIFRMYRRHAALHGWKLELFSLSEGEAGGYKEIIANISGSGVFGRLKYESGVHRVQRVPQTESGGRIHTSAATVAVLPSPREIDIQIRPEELRLDTFRASGAGGQHVNKTDSAVRITHLPTGISAISSEKSQHMNRARAMEILKARLHDQQRNQADQERAQTRKNQVGSGDRSQRIRTYNFPEKRVSDHRIGLTLYKLDAIINGEALDEIIDALITEEQARLLAALQSGES